MIAFKQTRQRVPVPSDGWCVIVAEDLETTFGLLVAADSAGGNEAARGAKALRVVATSGCILLPNGGKVPHAAQSGDIVFPAPRTEGSPEHPLMPHGHMLMRLVDVAGYIVDEAARATARAKAAGLHVPKGDNAEH